jgi:hypothetical protein
VPVALLRFAQHRRGAAQPPILDRVSEDVETALVVHGELARDPAGFLKREDLPEVLLGV